MGKSGGAFESSYSGHYLDLARSCHQAAWPCDRCQVRRQLLFCVEHSPLHRSYRDGVGSSDLMIFPLFDEAEFHGLSLVRIQERHPIEELERQCPGGIMAGGDQTLSDVGHVHSFHFPRLLTVVPAESVTRNLEQPGAKQLSVANLRSLTVNGEHHFLRQVLGQGQCATARPEECHDLWRKDLKQVTERVFARNLQKFLRH